MKPKAGPKAAALKIPVLRLSHARGLPLPAYQTSGAAGMDLLAAVDAGAPLTLEPFERALVPTGLALELPEGFEAQVRPRSGLAMRFGIGLLNSPGTIDSDYRGEVKVLLINLGEQAFQIERGERIAQLVVAPVTRAVLVAETRLSRSARGAGGFGSTGTAARQTRKRAAKSGAKSARRPSGPSRKAKPANTSAGAAAKGPAKKKPATRNSKKAKPKSKS